MIELVQYFTWKKVRGGYESASRVAFVKHGGRKWLQVLCIDATASGGMKLWKVPLSDTQYMRPLLRKGKPYPMKRALVSFRRMGKTHGITKGAKKLLKEASAQISN
jgi:hypothetical protein